MAKNTKERILEAALEIFARDGYSETNIKDIAEAVGIVKSALYRHFDSKEAIWRAVRDMMALYYEQNFGSLEHMPPTPDSKEELYEMTMHMVDFTIHDLKIIQTRKILMTEQFRDEKTRDCANNYFLYGIEGMFTRIFREMMEKGILRSMDPQILAFSYTSPITVLIHLCDRDPKKEPEAMERMQAFIRLFLSEYAV